MAELNKIGNVNLAELDENTSLEEKVKGKKKEEKLTNKVQDIYEEGRVYKIDAEITKEEIRSFFFGHAYRQWTVYALFAMGVGFGIYVGITTGNTIFAVLIPLLMIVYYPITLALKARKQKIVNKTFQQIFHYTFDEKACHLKLDKEGLDVEWKYFTKILLTKHVAVIYTGKINGYIVPLKDMGDQKDEIIAFLQEKINKK